MKRIVKIEDEPLCTALLVPMPADALKRAAAKWCGRKQWGGVDPSEFEVIAGRGAYSALVERRPGSEGGEDRLAKDLLRTIAGPIYALEFDLEWECHVRVFQRGKPVDWREHEDPHEVAERLQVPLPKPATGVEEFYSAARVEGASAAEVKAALKEYYDGERVSVLHVEPIEGGVLVWMEDGDIGLAADDAASALPKATVYAVRRRADLNRMTVYVLRGGVKTGTFQLPPGDVQGVPTLADVKGATTPGAIADVLGIPRKHIGLG